VTSATRLIRSVQLALTAAAWSVPVKNTPTPTAARSARAMLARS